MVDDFFIWQQWMIANVPSPALLLAGTVPYSAPLGLSSGDTGTVQSPWMTRCIQWVLIVGGHYARVRYPESSRWYGRRMLICTWSIKPGMKFLWIPAPWEQWVSKGRDRKQDQLREISCHIPKVLLSCLTNFKQYYDAGAAELLCSFSIQALKDSIDITHQ